MTDKIRPIAMVEYSEENDERDDYHYIAYYCPICRIRTWGYEKVTACNNCGTFYDWSKMHIFDGREGTEGR